MTKYRIRQSTGLCLDRSKLGTRQQAPNGGDFDHRFIASTETLASDGGVILLSAWRLARYQARPRWIAMHDVFGWSGKLTEITLGRAVWAGIEDGFPIAQVGETGRALVVYVRYADTKFAQEVKLLYEEGGLDDVSVRWDPRTEDVRNPFEEEVGKYGEDVKWVAVRVDLVELSAVLLGADQGPNMVGGAQLIRAAFERCRAEGHTMREVPALIDRIEGMRQKRQEDEAALTDSLGLLQQAIDAFDAWLQGSGDIREALGDAVANLAALLSQEQQTGTTSAGDGSDDDERQGGLTVEKLRAAVEALTEAIDKLVATRSAGDGGGEGTKGGGSADGADGGDGAGGDGDGARGGDGDGNEARTTDERLEAVETALAEVTELLRAGHKPKAEGDDDKKKKKSKKEQDEEDKKKGKKGKVVSGGDQQGGDGGEKYDATKNKGKGKKGDDPPDGGERVEGGDPPTGEAEGGEATGGDAGDGGDGEGNGDSRSWSELGDDDKIEIDFDAILAEGSASEADNQ